MTPEEAKDQAAKEVGFKDFSELYTKLETASYVKINWHNKEVISKVIDRAMQIYASHASKESYNRAINDAAQHATAHVEYDEFDGTRDAVVNKESILELLIT